VISFCVVFFLACLALGFGICQWFDLKGEAVDKQKLGVELDVEMYAAAELFWGSAGELKEGCTLEAHFGKDLSDQTGFLLCDNAEALRFASGFFAAFMVQVETIFNVEMIEMSKELELAADGVALGFEDASDELVVFED